MSVDTRHEARRTIERALPEGGRVVHYSREHGRPDLLTPDFIYRRQHRSAESFSVESMAQMYHRLASRHDLPPLFLSYPSGSVSLAEPDGGSVAVACRLQHPLSPGDGIAGSGHVEWHHSIDAGTPGAAVFDPVDMYFVPIAAFDSVWRSGPDITLGSVPLARSEPVPSARAYFQLLASLSDASMQLGERNWSAASRSYDEILAGPYYLPELLSISDLAGLYYGSGVSRFAAGDPRGAIDRWTEGVRLCPTKGLMRFNLAAALLTAGRYREAARQSVALLRQQPGHTDAWHNLAISLNKMGRDAEADAARRRDSASLQQDGLLARWMQQSEGD